MKILNDKDYTILEQICKISQDQLIKVMSSYLKNKYKTIYTDPAYIIAVGDIPVGLVAHMDTVFTAPPEEIYYDKKKNVMWSPQGLGADDRAGIYAIIRILQAGYRPTIILTTDEEIGALGASAIVADFPQCPTSLKYIIQLDRRGGNDCVFYDCDNNDFNEYVESFGFVTNFGTFSDISIICPHWEIAGTNLSIGYIREHSISETLHVGSMINTINRVCNMLDYADKASSFKYIEAPYVHTKWKWGSSFGIETCSICNQRFVAENVVPVGKAYVCIDCLNKSDHIGWCNNCGEAYFKVGIEDIELCDKCAKEIGGLNDGI